jgi:hypothetical protein
MTSHVEAKQILDAAVPGIHPADSLLTRIIGSMETQYGGGWGHGLSNAGIGSNNWGAITKGSWKGDTFTHTDSRWDEDQQRQVTYSTQFRWYPTPEAGASDLYRLLTGSRHGKASELARAGRWDEISRAIGPLGSYYYAGFGPPAEATEKHRSSFLARKAEIMAETGENPDAPGTPSMGAGEKPKPPQTSSSSSGLVSVVGLGLVLVALWRISVAVAKTDSSA